MRLVLFLEYEGDYECAGASYVWPIEHPDKDVALLELQEAIAVTRKAWNEFREASREWWKSQPKLPKPYGGKNQRVVEKHKKDDEKYEQAVREWHSSRPLPPNDQESVVFCGHRICLNDLCDQDIRILTLDEWYAEPVS